MTTFVDQNNNRIAFKFSIADIQKGLTFFSEDKDFLQVGTWNYDKGKKLLAHIHNNAPREILRTQEFVFVVKGKMKTLLYDEHAQFIQEVVLNPQEGMILLSGGHGYEILEKETIIIEVKNGPYAGAELDRRRIEK